MERRHALLASAAAPLVGCAGVAMPLDGAGRAARVAELRAAETAFARTMAERSLDGFAAFVADDAVFINGGQPLQGRAAIVAFWKRFYEGAAAPFAWAPEVVEVNAGGDLGYSEGPVRNPAGVVILRFVSTWRRGADGRWRVIFDNGFPVCGPR